jgi:hypothetical protein
MSRSPIFTAAFPGKCAACGERIVEGDRIGKRESVYMCEVCVQVYDDAEDSLVRNKGQIEATSRGTTSGAPSTYRLKQKRWER